MTALSAVSACKSVWEHKTNRINQKPLIQRIRVKHDGVKGRIEVISCKFR